MCEGKANKKAWGKGEATPPNTNLALSPSAMEVGCEKLALESPTSSNSPPMESQVVDPNPLRGVTGRGETPGETTVTLKVDNKSYAITFQPNSTLSTIMETALSHLRIPMQQVYFVHNGKSIPPNKQMSQIGINTNDFLHIQGRISGGSVNTTNMNFTYISEEENNPFMKAKKTSEQNGRKKPTPIETSTKQTGGKPLVIPGKPKAPTAREQALQAIAQVSYPRPLAAGTSTSLCEPNYVEIKHPNSNLDDGFRQTKRKKGPGTNEVTSYSNPTTTNTTQRYLPKMKEPSVKSDLQTKLRNMSTVPEQKNAIVVKAPPGFPEVGYYRRAQAAMAHIALLSSQDPQKEDNPIPTKVATFGTREEPKLYIQYEEEDIDKVKMNLPTGRFSIPKVGVITGVVGPFDKKSTMTQKRKLLERIPNIIIAADGVNRSRAFFAAAVTSKNEMITFSETSGIDFRIDPPPTRSPYCRHCFKEYHVKTKGTCPQFNIPFCKDCTMQGHVAENCGYQKFCANCNINGHSTYQCRNSKPQRQKLVRRKEDEEYVESTPVREARTDSTSNTTTETKPHQQDEMKDDSTRDSTAKAPNTQAKPCFAEVVIESERKEKEAEKKKANAAKRKKLATKNRIKLLEKEKPLVYPNIKASQQKRGRSKNQKDKNRNQQRAESQVSTVTNDVQDDWEEEHPTQPTTPRMHSVTTTPRVQAQNGCLDREQPLEDVQDQEPHINILQIHQMVAAQMEEFKQKVVKMIDQKLEAVIQSLQEQMMKALSDLMDSKLERFMAQVKKTNTNPK